MSEKNRKTLQSCDSVSDSVRFKIGRSTETVDICYARLSYHARANYSAEVSKPVYLLPTTKFSVAEKDLEDMEKMRRFWVMGIEEGYLPTESRALIQEDEGFVVEWDPIEPITTYALVPLSVYRALDLGYRYWDDLMHITRVLEGRLAWIQGVIGLERRLRKKLMTTHRIFFSRSAPYSDCYDQSPLCLSCLAGPLLAGYLLLRKDILNQDPNLKSSNDYAGLFLRERIAIMCRDLARSESILRRLAKKVANQDRGKKPIKGIINYILAPKSMGLFQGPLESRLRAYDERIRYLSEEEGVDPEEKGVNLM